MSKELGMYVFVCVYAIIAINLIESFLYCFHEFQIPHFLHLDSRPSITVR